MKNLGRGIVVLGFAFVLGAVAILALPAFREERNWAALGWWISSSFLLGFGLLWLGVHLWSKNGPRGA